MEEAAARRQPDLTVVIENVHDPHNVSAILRSCDAVGVNEVQLVYTNEVFPKLGKKSSASALKWVSRRRFSSIGDCYGVLRKEGFAIYATRLETSARSLYDVDLVPPTAVVVGNEHRGVSAEAAEQADGIIQIPMVGMIQSLNVSVACAVILFEAMRQRQAAGSYRVPKFPPAQLRMLMEQWTRKR
jgi:tRNA (guanosine-2'-O-)-methyltransferase